MKRFILMAIATTLFLSCNKESNKTTQSSSTSKVTVIHDAHFYDSLGLLHNQILASLHLASAGKQPQTTEGFQRFLADYMKKKQSGSTISTNNLPPEKVIDIIKHYLRNDFGTIKNPEVESYLRSIFDQVKATESFDTVFYKESIHRIENEIRWDKKLPAVAKHMLLATAAIAKHSGSYWLHFYNNQTDEMSRHRLNIFDKLVKAIGVTLADATAIAYDYLSNRPADEWVEDAANFSELGYWSIEYILGNYPFY